MKIMNRGRIKLASLFFNAALLPMLLFPHHLWAATKLDWKIHTEGKMYEKVSRKLPNFKSYVEEYSLGTGMLKPILAIASTDLNQDGKPEIIAYIPRDADLYAKNDPGDLHTIFRVKPSGALEIIDTFHAVSVMLSEKSSNGHRDLIVFDNYSDMQKGYYYRRYKWQGSGKGYEPVGREKLKIKTPEK